MKVNISFELDAKDDIQEVRLLIQSLKELVAGLGAQEESVTIQKSPSKQQETKGELQLVPPHQEPQMPTANGQPQTPVDETPEYVIQIKKVVEKIRSEDKAAISLEWIINNSNTSSKNIGIVLTNELLSIQQYSEEDESVIGIFTGAVARLSEQVQYHIKKELVHTCVSGLMENNGDKAMIYNWSLVLAFATKSGLLDFDKAMQCVLKLLRENNLDPGIILLGKLTELMADKVQKCGQISQIRKILESNDIQGYEYELDYLRQSLGWK